MENSRLPGNHGEGMQAKLAAVDAALRGSGHVEERREQALACGGMWIANRFVYQEQQSRCDPEFLKERVGQEFEIEIAACQEINWGDNRKREAFKCELV
jgi:hypothetical protein